MAEKRAEEERGRGRKESTPTKKEEGEEEKSWHVQPSVNNGKETAVEMPLLEVASADMSNQNVRVGVLAEVGSIEASGRKRSG